MTRINLVPPAELHTKHLHAEWRELPRIFGCVAEAIARGERPDDPRNPRFYVLGTGHMRFFYPRLLFLARRHGLLTAELVARGYNLTPRDPLMSLLSPLPAITPGSIPRIWWGDYEPTPPALALNRERIALRMPGAAKALADPPAYPMAA